MGGGIGKPEAVNVNADIYSAVWLDGEVDTRKENIVYQAKLRAVINDLETFKDDEICEAHIRAMPEGNRIVFISNGGLGQKIVPRIHQLRQVLSIYIFCFQKEKHQEWAEKYVKVRHVCTSLRELMTCIRTDQEARKFNKVDEQLSIGILNTRHLNNNDEIYDRFIYSQVLIDCLFRMPITPAEKNELISICKTNYKGNNTELREIREFEENHSFDNIIRWYTKNSFLYKLLNKAFRAQDIDLLLSFRYIIQDIQHQIEVIECPSTNPVYRAQLLSKDELQMFSNSYNQFISINSFLSATPDRRLARYTLNDAKVSSDVERVLFEIRIDENFDDTEKQYANIEGKSFTKQQEILFSIGSIFQITTIHQDSDKIWIIQMTLCSKNHPDLQLAFQTIEDRLGNANESLLSFGLVAQHLNKFDEAKKYYTRLLKILPQNDNQYIKAQRAIESIPRDKQFYENRLKSIGKSVSDIEVTKKNDTQTAFMHFNMGDTYRIKDDFENALKFYKKAMEIWEKRSDNNYHHQLGRCYNNIGWIYQEMDKDKDALSYYSKAKPILQQHISRIHPDFIKLCLNMGDVYVQDEQYDRALENYEEVLAIISTERVSTSEDSSNNLLQNSASENASNNSFSIPTNEEPSKILLMNKIADVYEKKRNFEFALNYYHQIALLLPSTGADTEKNNKNIARVSRQL